MWRVWELESLGSEKRPGVGVALKVRYLSECTPSMREGVDMIQLAHRTLTFFFLFFSMKVVWTGKGFEETAAAYWA